MKPQPTSKEGQAGQTLVIFALVSAFVLSAMIALVANAQMLYINFNRADDAALLAAQAGASALDPNSIYTDHVQLDHGLALSRCSGAARQAPYIIEVDCSATPTVVTARVVLRVPLPIPVLPPPDVSATRTASIAYGGSLGGF